MSRLFFITAVLSIGICFVARLHADTPVENVPVITGEAILKDLSEKQGTELFDFLSLVRRSFYARDWSINKSASPGQRAGNSEPARAQPKPSVQFKLTNQEIDRILERLVAIQTSDPCQKEGGSKGGEKRILFPNRRVSESCIHLFQFEKIANGLRELPMEERVRNIMDGLDRQDHLVVGSDSHLSAELVRAGRDAVPFIVQYKPLLASRWVISALVKIGDPRGIEYILTVLKTQEARFQYERPIAADALAKFNDKRVVPSLVDALQDESFQNIDRNEPQLVGTTHNPCIGRYYLVQHSASRSLTALTGKDWGHLYNEDYKTWSSWLRSEDRDKFTPAVVPRSDDETAKLVEYVFHRYMSARPNAWQPQNILAGESGVRSVAADLKQLG